MSYTIDERNPERQQLLAQLLAPSTREVLARLPRIPNARCLDLGCGQGNTTRLLAEAMGAAACVGVEYDPALVEYASTQVNPASVSFQQVDVTRLSLPDASFDVVFCRFLLIHLADPMSAVREMLRVVRPGGYVVAYEPDFVGEFSDPESSAFGLIKRTYRLTAEATGPLAQARGILSELEVREMVDGLARLEDDPTSVLAKFPDVWAIAQR